MNDECEIVDEIVDEIHAIREAHAARFNYDLDAIYADIVRSEEEHRARGAVFIDPPASNDMIQSEYRKIRFNN
jgi:hypothetical protein